MLRTFAGAAALALVLVAGAAFAMMGDRAPQSPQVEPGAPVDQAPKGSAQEDAGQGAGDVSQGGAAPSNDSLNADDADDVDDSAPPQGSTNGMGGGTASPEAAAQTVRDVYKLAAAGDYETSYALLSSGFQEEAGSVESWAGTFSTLESISFTEGPTASASGNTARATGTTQAVHTDETEFNRGSWTLVRENGEWRLDSVSVQKL